MKANNNNAKVFGTASQVARIYGAAEVFGDLDSVSRKNCTNSSTVPQLVKSVMSAIISIIPYVLSAFLAILLSELLRK